MIETLPLFSHGVDTASLLCAVHEIFQQDEHRLSFHTSTRK